MHLTLDDRITIHELMGLHGHLVDSGELDRLHELFTSDVVYDVSALGGSALHGIDAIVNAARALGDANPLAHHVTNVLITGVDGDVVRVVSKGLGVRTDGTTGSVTYHDEVRRGETGWRISRRRVSPRRRPLHP